MEKDPKVTARVMDMAEEKEKETAKETAKERGKSNARPRLLAPRKVRKKAGVSH